MTPNAPFYNAKPVGSVAALAKALGVEESRLWSVDRRVDHLYRGPILVKRPGKKPRDTYAPLAPLLDLQQRILDRLLKKAQYPDYLMGGLPGRNYIQNARLHAGAKIVFGQDVESFFPSITRQRVEAIFKHLFHFAPEVAALLSRLCSRRGVLAQGALTSNHLANLALYREEPTVERKARALGLTYTRYVDDIHLSSRQQLTRESLSATVQTLRSALERLGHTPKRTKQFIATPRQAMLVHRLNVNSVASVPAKQRQSLRNEVFRLERRLDAEGWNESLEAAYRSLCARVGHLKHTNPGDARRLRVRLDALGSRRPS